MAGKESKKRTCKNPFYSIQFFVFCQGFLHFTQLLTSSYMKSSISTIEKRFGLSSQMSGFIVSFNEVGNTVLIIFVSYLGSRVHRPRLIGCGAILVSLAAFIISLPHFITEPYEYDRSVSVKSNITDICLPGKPDSAQSDQCSSKKAQEFEVVLFLIFLGQLLMGIGTVPIQPFGISYIDDFASKTNSPLYLGVLFAATTLGPAVAFLLGAVTLRFYVDINRVPIGEIGINHKDPRWIGAWWLGFLISASLVALSSIPYFFFPRALIKQEDPQKVITLETVTKDDFVEDMNAKAHEEQNLSFTQFLKMFPMALVRNMRNPVFVVVVLALINLSGMVAGLATFLAKFLERQFNLTASFANMLLGGVNIPAGMLGIVLGGAIIKNCHLSLRQAAAMCIFSMALCVLFDIPLLFLGCPTQRIAGLDSTGSSKTIQTAAECNKMCSCSASAFNPVCGQDKIEYVSPCFAGCTVVNLIENTNKVANFSRCNCISVKNALGYAVPGSCGSQCAHFLVPFVTLACISGFVASLAHTPAFVMILRSVRPEDKSFAIGIQFLMIRVAAWLPAPVLYGSIIDTTCLLWQKRCDKKAACRYYDHTLFRQRFMAVQLVFEISGFLCYCIVYLLFWRKEKRALQLEVIPQE
ncbi:solute carrier organic anion transporter family member 2B1 isoform X1 [Tiliqua scincoides]|uniref:solute carrier organic anion transporter family member 2B1 isoform X1 n=1 Tax=Tiliqua scincoides TaxID=71010 RepID=UPI0034628A94